MMRCHLRVARPWLSLLPRNMPARRVTEEIGFVSDPPSTSSTELQSICQRLSIIINFVPSCCLFRLRDSVLSWASSLSQDIRYWQRMIEREERAHPACCLCCLRRQKPSSSGRCLW
ncbi:hypothetical protein PAXRUDRAFT_462834 [Paxillus rubicundulus Ve08.2h10]|uniref:Uncharacterized protein n=1 Tax=Paxillus rubicundulus Ve08.2h10 TaxID=930991 RepID=A0A0D0EB07_9AGAM|nr:hypothetical protein PAXRUDRAFT_462834 [Paxillus rubicundulus Ve08.2h10]